MINILRARIKQGYRTGKYPLVSPVLPDRMAGMPLLDCSKCSATCSNCIAVCPTNCIGKRSSGISLDTGKCIFCNECTKACSQKAITFSTDHRLAAKNRQDMIVDGAARKQESLRLESARLKLFQRSLKLRQVSAGGCNACEADVNVLNTLVFDLARFGIQFVASPRHADGLLVTGPVTKNMELAVKKTYDATPGPKIVIAVGACAISGGLFASRQECNDGVEKILPVDLYIPGCPPHPYTILDGLLRLLDRI